MKDEDTNNWGLHWTLDNDEFEAKLVLNPHLHFLCGCMFFIYNGNNWFKAWIGYIDRLNGDDQRVVLLHRHHLP